MTERIRVLHLEDDALDAELIRERLAADPSHQWEFVHVRGGPAFLSELAAGGFDLVITDLNIPGFNGKEAIRLARLSNRQVPIMVVSGSMSPSDHEACVAAGATRVVIMGEPESIVEVVTGVIHAARGR